MLLVGSHVFISIRKDHEPAPDEARALVELEGNNLAYLEWGGANKNKPPIILLHGSPGAGAMDFRRLGPELARDGRLVIAPDRWGFGQSQGWVEDYSFNADAEAVIGLMDQLGIGSAHVAGWSYGAAPAVILGETQPGRIRSVTMIAGIGIQEGEGSGSYLLEHGKYAVNVALAFVLPELVPHFGLLGSRGARYAYARDFWDCDQRPLKRRLQKMDAPLLILHGKNDLLVPAWVAREHQILKQGSRLVVLDAGHYFPLAKAGSPNLTLVGEEMRAFLMAADEGKTEGLVGVRNETSRKDLRAMWDGGPPMREYRPWWLVVLPGIVLGLVIPRTGGVLAGLAGGLMLLDWMTAVLGVVLGAIMRPGDSSRPRKAATVVAMAAVAAVPALLIAWLL